MSSLLSTIIVIGVIGVAIIKRCDWFKICGNPLEPAAQAQQTPTSSPTPAPVTNGACNPNLMKAMLHPHDAGMRLDFGECITVTGTVVGEKEPHYAPDGDLVFALKLDPQYQHYVNDKNNAAKYQGGIWCEAVCVTKNNSTDVWHKGDCSVGGPFPKFPTPKRGDRLKVTGIHTIDNGEGGHAEIHPVSSIEFLSKTTPAPKKTVSNKKAKSHITFMNRLSRVAI